MIHPLLGGSEDITSAPTLSTPFWNKFGTKGHGAVTRAGQRDSAPMQDSTDVPEKNLPPNTPISPNSHNRGFLKQQL